MLENFYISLSGVVPLFCLMLVGVFVKYKNFLTEAELSRVNGMVFNVFFFFMMFYNLYITDLEKAFSPRLIAMGVGGMIVSLLVFGAVVCYFERRNSRRSILLQAVYRTTFVFMGLPLVTNIFGSASSSIPTMLIAFTVPLANILAVIILEIFRDDETQLNIVELVLHTAKNPMIFGAILGVVLRLAGVVLPLPICKPIAQIAAATSPVALIILGASFKLGSYHQHEKELVWGVLLKLIIVPAVLLGVAVYLGFREIELLTLVGLFATPCTVAIFPMAQAMGADSELAGNLIVYSSLFSCFTIFAWVFAFKSLGLI